MKGPGIHRKSDLNESLKIGDMCGCWISPIGELWTCSYGHHQVAALDIMEEKRISVSNYDRPGDQLLESGYIQISLWSEFGVNPRPTDSQKAVDTARKFLTDNDCETPREWR